MFSHAIGMGLFEDRPLRWLSDEEWKTCGYLVEHDETNESCKLSREPLRRFDDIEGELPESFSLVNTDTSTSVDHVIECIKEIKEENPSVKADDIGIIFIGHNKDGYELADRLEFSAVRTFGWPVNKAYETKTSLPDHLFISNQNNVKGLEFPFVICVTETIKRAPNYRNALYMMLTRSFIKTYFLLSKEANKQVFDLFENGLKVVNREGHMNVRVPTQVEQNMIKTNIQIIGKNISFGDFMASIFDEVGVKDAYRDDLYNSTKSIIGDNFDHDKAYKIVKFNYDEMDK